MFCTTMAVSTVCLCAAALVSALLMMQVKMDADTSVVVPWHLLFDAPVAEQDGRSCREWVSLPRSPDWFETIVCSLDNFDNKRFQYFFRVTRDRADWLVETLYDLLVKKSTNCRELPKATRQDYFTTSIRASKLQCARRWRCALETALTGWWRRCMICWSRSPPTVGSLAAQSFMRLYGAWGMQKRLLPWVKGLA